MTEAVNRSCLRALLGLSLTVAGGCAGDDDAPVRLRLVLAAEDCTPVQLAKINSLGAERSGDPPQIGPCTALNQDAPRTLETIQRALHQSTAFRELNAEQTTVTVRGYLDESCQEPVGLCGTRELAAPRQHQELGLGLHCWGGARPAVFDSCSPGAESGVLQLHLGPNTCSTLDSRFITAMRLKAGDDLQECRVLPPVDSSDGRSLTSYERLQNRVDQLLRLKDPADLLELKLWLYASFLCNAAPAGCATAEPFHPPYAPELPLRCDACPPLTGDTH